MSAVRRYTYKAATTVLGGQDIINLDFFKIPFQVGVLVDLVSGNITYAIEYTMDHITGVVDLGAIRWQQAPIGTTSATVQYTFNFPVTAIRLNILSMTGEVRLTAIQGLGTTI
jgi:hypothetical protein